MDSENHNKRKRLQTLNLDLNSILHHIKILSNAVKHDTVVLNKKEKKECEELLKESYNNLSDLDAKWFYKRCELR